MKPNRSATRRWLAEYRWTLIGFVAAATFVLGFFGFSTQFRAAGDERPVTDILYLTLQLFTLESGAVSREAPWMLEIARFLAPVVAASAAIGALGTFFQEQVHSFRLRRSRDHVVVCGSGWRGSFIARRFHERGTRVVVIEHNEDATGVAACRAVGIPVVVGDATDVATLARTRCDRARLLISVCGGDEDTLQVGVAAREVLAEDRDEPPHMLLHISDPRLASLARATESGRRPTRVDSFNVYERGARQWVQEHPPFSRGAERGPEQPHLLVVGLGQLGRYVVAEVVRTWLATRVTDDLMTITVVDRDAERAVEELKLDYPSLDRFAVVRPWTVDVHAPEFRRCGFLFDDVGTVSISHVYICMKDTTEGLKAALHIRERVIGADLPVVIRTTEETGLTRVLTWGDSASAFGDLRAFPVLERACAPEVLLGETVLDLLARTAHDAYVEFAAARRDGTANTSVTPWEDLPEHLRESNRRQVMHIGAKLRAIGCGVAVARVDGSTLVRVDEAERAIGAPVARSRVTPHALTADEIEALAQIEHDRWVAERLFDGWTYRPGPKDAIGKTTPDLAAWEALSEATRELDRNVVRAIPRILERAGLEIVRGSVGEVPPADGGAERTVTSDFTSA